MNASLPPELERFVKKKIKDGLYNNESDVVCDALRGLREREHSLQRKLTAPSAPTSSQFAAAISNMGVGDGDIEAIAFIVLTQATGSMDEDLKMIMAEVKAMTAAKQKLRELITKVNKDVANNAGQGEPKRRLIFSSGGMGSEKAYHHAQLPFPDPSSESGVRFIQSDLHSAIIESVEVLESIRDELTGKLEGMSEMSEITSLRLQMMMDRRSKFISTLSNIMKKISNTQDTLVQNLK